MFTAPEVKILEASFIIHATEDMSRVEDAIGKALGFTGFKSTVVRGHYGNPIRYYRGVIKRGEAKVVFERLVKSLGAEGLSALLHSYESHVKRNQLYLRLDKQSIVSGGIEPGERDVVRIRVVFKSRRDLRKWIEYVYRLQG